MTKSKNYFMEDMIMSKKNRIVNAAVDMTLGNYDEFLAVEAIFGSAEDYERNEVASAEATPRLLEALRVDLGMRFSKYWDLMRYDETEGSVVVVFRFWEVKERYRSTYISDFMALLDGFDFEQILEYEGPYMAYKVTLTRSNALCVLEDLRMTREILTEGRRFDDVEFDRYMEYLSDSGAFCDGIDESDDGGFGSPESDDVEAQLSIFDVIGL